MTDDLKLCACGEFYEAHHLECPAARQYKRAADALEAAQDERDIYHDQYVEAQAEFEVAQQREKGDAIAIEGLGRELEAAQVEIADLKCELSDAAATNAHMKAEIERLTASRNHYRDTYLGVQAEYEREQAENAKLQAVVDALREAPEPPRSELHPGYCHLPKREAYVYWYMNPRRKALAALDTGESAKCNHSWIDPTNEVVSADNHEICKDCGLIRRIDTGESSDG